jgi:uncharacterized membrane protein HdeD (DUF308 family)
MVASVDPEIRADIREFSKAWWIFLVTGILWVFVGMFVLQFNLDSVYAIAVLFGIVFLFASVDEFFAMVVMPGWRWLHALLGVLFLFAGIWAFAYPEQTFGTLALLVGWFVLVKGVFDFSVALANRDLELWWLTLLAGILEIVIGFWAIGYPGRSAALLILWVGIGALVRGITEIILAFQVKSLQKLGGPTAVATP